MSFSQNMNDTVSMPYFMGVTTPKRLWNFYENIWVWAHCKCTGRDMYYMKTMGVMDTYEVLCEFQGDVLQQLIESW